MPEQSIISWFDNYWIHSIIINTVLITVTDFLMCVRSCTRWLFCCQLGRTLDRSSRYTSYTEMKCSRTDSRVQMWRSSILFLPSHKQHLEDGDWVSSRKVGKPSHLDAVCLRKFYWNVAPQNLQDFYQLQSVAYGTSGIGPIFVFFYRLCFVLTTFVLFPSSSEFSAHIYRGGGAY